MNIFGYSNKIESLQKMEEITLQVSMEELKEVEKFVRHTVALMECHGEKFWHEHLSDFTKIDSSIDIIITSSPES